jgi:uncharacterized protein YycO
VKRWLVLSLLGGMLVFGIPFPSYASATKMEPYVEEIVKMQPGSTKEEVLQDAKQIANMQNRSVEDVLKQIYQECSADIKKGEEEMREIFGDSDGDRYLVSSKKGNIYYTDSYTGGINHGHVGMYYKADGIVEATPDKKGVGTVKATKRKVYKGAVIQSVSTSTSRKNAAADWAYNRVGKDGYSYNFTTNRLTGHYGDKNCSKLLWSAFLLKSGLDIDKDLGYGVYPRDMRDSNLTTTIKMIR